MSQINTFICTFCIFCELTYVYCCLFTANLSSNLPVFCANYSITNNSDSNTANIPESLFSRAFSFSIYPSWIDCLKMFKNVLFSSILCKLTPQSQGIISITSADLMVIFRSDQVEKCILQSKHVIFYQYTQRCPSSWYASSPVTAEWEWVFYIWLWLAGKWRVWL